MAVAPRPRGGHSVGARRYLSAAAQLLRPSTARLVLDYLDAQPIYHVDAALRTPDAATFASYQYRSNMFVTVANVSESRAPLGLPDIQR